MTTSTQPLYQRLKNEDPFVSEALSGATTQLAGALFFLATDPRLCEDYAEVIEHLCQYLELPDDNGPRPHITVPEDSPADDRPLYQRLDAHPQAATMIKKSLNALLLVAALIENTGTRNDYYNVVEKFMCQDFGLPTVAQAKANPEAYPGTGPSALAQLIEEYGQDEDAA